MRVVWISLALAAAIALAGWAGVLPGSASGDTWAEAFPVFGGRGRWKQFRPDSGSGYPPQLEAAEARRDPRLPYLFDAGAQPTAEEACGHCDSMALVPDPKDRERSVAHPTGEPMLCCGVCQYEGRHCATMAPPGAMDAHLTKYQRQGFDFQGFTPEELWTRISGRTLWLVGDSQTWHWYYSAECFLRRYAVDLRRRGVTNNTKMVQELSGVSWPVYVTPSCLHLRNNTRVCAVRADDGGQISQHVLPAMIHIRGERLPGDIMVLNFGLHFNTHSRAKQYLDHINAVATYCQQHKGELPTVIWMTTPVQHFATAKGEYDPKELGKQCQPLTAWYEGDWHTTQGGPYNTLAAPAVEAAGWPVLDTWNATVPLWDVHKTGECTHWCSPSAYHVWLYLLNALLRERAIGNAVPDGAMFDPL